jgi:LPXTG-site transpeptidase (sortase) family protein
VKRISKLNIVEGAAWAAGSALLIAYATAEWHFTRAHRTGLQEFAAARQQARQLQLSTHDSSGNGEVRLAVGVHSRAADMPGSPIESHALLPAAAPDMTSWSAGRIAAYQTEDHSPKPEAVLRIRSIDLEVPVYAGVTETNLNRGAAWIDGTAPLGAAGNTGLASHRDGYFRALSGIGVGDRIELQTLRRTRVYAVDEIRVVEPEEVQVLAPTHDERLTLVTCYPFYMVGPAPKRFVVRARASARDPS